jgi:predicted amidohydrolase YtcJ
MIKKIFGSLALSTLLTTSLCATQLYTNFNGYHTPERALSKFSAMAIDNRKVLATGSYKELLQQFPSADIIDLDGKTLLPGLIDGHGHVTGLGLNLLRISLRDSPSERHSVEQVIKFAKNNPQLSWIRGRGWNQELWPSKQFPTNKSLDEKLSQRPVWLRRVDGHAGWANSKALAIAGIDRNTMPPSGGSIVKDKNGEPTGILIDNAMNLIELKIPVNSLSDVKGAINRAGNHLLSLGITSVHDAGISQLTYQAYNELVKDKKMPLRIYAMLSVTDPAYPAMLAQGIINTADDKLVIRSVKISADGALGSRGAAMLAPYSDDKKNTGLLLHSPKSLESNMEKAIDQGFQVNVHAIGDKANHLALNYFEQFNQHEKSRALRHRIEHAQVVSISDLPRFKQLDVLPSMQPTHATSDMNMAEDRLGHKRLKGAYAWRTLLNDGVRIVSGSDFPIEYANPFYGLHAAVSRQNRENKPALGWIAQEAITLPQALNSFTLDAAYGAHQDKVLGTLEKGKWADFIVIDQDIFAQPATAIWQPTVLGTWIGGEQVYSSTK